MISVVETTFPEAKKTLANVSSLFPCVMDTSPDCKIKATSFLTTYLDDLPPLPVDTADMKLDVWKACWKTKENLSSTVSSTCTLHSSQTPQTQF